MSKFNNIIPERFCQFIEHKLKTHGHTDVLEVQVIEYTREPSITDEVEVKYQVKKPIYHTCGPVQTTWITAYMKIRFEEIIGWCPNRIKEDKTVQDSEKNDKIWDAHKRFLRGK